MNTSDFVQSPVNVNGGLPMSLSPGPGAACWAGAGGEGKPPLPPPPPPPRGTPPGIPGFPPPGVLADRMGNLRPVNDCVGGLGRSSCKARNVATLSLVYMWPVRGLIAPSLIVVVVVCASVIGKSWMWSSAANLVTASTAGVWRTRMTLGELLWFDGVAGREGVVFSGSGATSLGASCCAIYRSRSVG